MATDSAPATFRLNTVRTGTGDRLTISARMVDATDFLETISVAQIIVHSSRHGPYYYTLLSRAPPNPSISDIRHLIQADVARYLVSQFEGRDAPCSPAFPYAHEDGWMLV